MNAPALGMCVIISGTPSAGFTVIGPFAHPAIAAEWGNAWEEDIDWWVAPLVAQSTREVPNPEE